MYNKKIKWYTARVPFKYDSDDRAIAYNPNWTAHSSDNVSHDTLSQSEMELSIKLPAGHNYLRMEMIDEGTPNGITFDDPFLNYDNVYFFIQESLDMATLQVAKYRCKVDIFRTFGTELLTSLNSQQVFVERATQNRFLSGTANSAFNKDIYYLKNEFDMEGKELKQVQPIHTFYTPIGVSPTSWLNIYGFLNIAWVKAATDYDYVDNTFVPSGQAGVNNVYSELAPYPVSTPNGESTNFPSVFNRAETETIKLGSLWPNQSLNAEQGFSALNNETLAFMGSSTTTVKTKVGKLTAIQKTTILSLALNNTSTPTKNIFYTNPTLNSNQSSTISNIKLPISSAQAPTSVTSFSWRHEPKLLTDFLRFGIRLKNQEEQTYDVKSAYQYNSLDIISNATISLTTGGVVSPVSNIVMARLNGGTTNKLFEWSENLIAPQSNNLYTNYLQNNAAQLDNAREQAKWNVGLAYGKTFGAATNLFGLGSLLNPAKTIENIQGAHNEKKKIELEINDLKNNADETKSIGSQTYFNSMVNLFENTGTDPYNKNCPIDVTIYFPREQQLERIAYYWHVYGYDINGSIRTWNNALWNSREDFNYIQLSQTADLSTLSNPVYPEHMDEFFELLKRGIRIWHKDNANFDKNTYNREKITITPTIETLEKIAEEE